MHEFQSPCGDSLFSDAAMGLVKCALEIVFQSPCGDSLFSDQCVDRLNELQADEGFNPLAGIRCFLTRHLAKADSRSLLPYLFQSPCGDSLFSDVRTRYWYAHAIGTHTVSIPLRGFVVF